MTFQGPSTAALSSTPTSPQSQATFAAAVSKYRRALRNQTGANFTLDQLREMARHGVLELLARLEAEYLCHEKTPLTSSETTGSTNVGTVKPLALGKSLTPTNGGSYIAALTANA